MIRHEYRIGKHEHGDTMEYAKCTSRNVSMLCCIYQTDEEASFAQAYWTNPFDEMKHLLEVFLHTYCYAIMFTMGPVERMMELDRLKKELPICINIAQYNEAYEKTRLEVENVKSGPSS